VYYIRHYENGGGDMSKKTVIIMPKTREILEHMGEQIRLARLRRKLSSQLVAERAGISRQTLTAIEKGTSTVSIGSYAAVLHALNNLDSDLLLIAKDDEFGRKLQDLNLPIRKRAPKKGDI
jgi:transcriptional regulator with XRE-family HTH domain